jgi:hypothetical protein
MSPVTSVPAQNPCPRPPMERRSTGHMTRRRHSHVTSLA